MCEICDRDPVVVIDLACRNLGWPLPRGDGRGWVVRHYWPGRDRLLSAGVDVIFTCGDHVCMHRATANGVPGMRYPITETR